MDFNKGKNPTIIYRGVNLADNIKIVPMEVTDETEKQYKVDGVRINKNKINTVTATGICYSLTKEGAIKLLLEHNEIKLECYKASVDSCVRAIDALNSMLVED